MERCPTFPQTESFTCSTVCAYPGAVISIHPFCSLEITRAKVSPLVRWSNKDAKAKLGTKTCRLVQRSKKVTRPRECKCLDVRSLQSNGRFSPILLHPSKQPKLYVPLCCSEKRVALDPTVVCRHSKLNSFVAIVAIKKKSAVVYLVNNNSRLPCSISNDSDGMIRRNIRARI